MVKITNYVMIISLMISLNCNTVISAQNKTARLSSCHIIMDCQYIDKSSCTVFNIDGNNYFKLRDIAIMVSKTLSKFNIIWNASDNTICINTNEPYIQNKINNLNIYDKYKVYYAVKSNQTIVIDGVETPLTAYKIDDNNYFKLRDLAPFISLTLGWYEPGNDVLIATKSGNNVIKTLTQSDFNSNIVTSTFERWASTKKSYIFLNDDSTVSTFNITYSDKIEVDTYDQDMNIMQTKKVNFELQIFGAFYSSNEYRFIAFGRDNLEQNNKKEVIRIVKYDKNFNKIAQVSINGGESFTIVPFDAGCGRMSSFGNYLVFHTSRLRYRTDDGLNHQSQLTIIIDIERMKVVNYLGEFQENHVSHSFDQYVVFEGENHVLLDHGDAYPRSIVIHRSIDPSGNAYESSNIFNIPGAIGANCTGVSVGGFDVSQNKYLVAMNTINHKLVKNYTSYTMEGLTIDQRDILLCTIPKDNFKSTYVNQIVIGKYVGSNKLASIPTLVKINDNQFIILWQEFNLSGSITGLLKYIKVDGNGIQDGEVKSISGFVLSECQPMIINDYIMWFANNGHFRYFYKIPITN